MSSAMSGRIPASGLGTPPNSRMPRSASNSMPPSRSSTPKPYSFDKPANDHVVSWRSRIPPKDYPPDCPPLSVRWFYAVDVPKRTTYPTAQAPSKPPKLPSKYVPFGSKDSQAIEAAFLRLAEAGEMAQGISRLPKVQVNLEDAEGDLGERHGTMRPARRNTLKDDVSEEDVKVPVNEDYLFDVDIRNRELSPVYWLGPSYDIRRGTWFYQEGSTLRPCDENLAMQLEEAYLKVTPFRQVPPAEKTSGTRGADAASENPPKVPLDVPTVPKSTMTRRLFGEHMNSFVLFADATTAWIMTDDFYGKLSSTLYQRVTSGSHMGGTRVVRGYFEGAKTATEKKSEAPTVSVSRPVTPTPESKALRVEVNQAFKRRSMPPPSTAALSSDPSKPETPANEKLDPRRALERRLSSYESEKVEENEILEEEMKGDYKSPDEENSEDQGREIDHLLLATHGIGQRLSERLASVNFVHDVNVFRKTLKSVYGYSPDLQALNGEIGDNKKNCRIQCLPVCWRHLVDFPERSVRLNRNMREFDLGAGDQQNSMEDEYPSLADITVEGVPAVRSLITDLALDILLYQSPTYREHIAWTVLDECNRIYALFKKRNPGFRGKVSLVGHSLGSAVFFDLLCRQPDKFGGKGMGFIHSNGKPLVFDFPVENLFCLGSPVGLFQMLKGRTIAARSSSNPTNLAQSPLDPEYISSTFPIQHQADLHTSTGLQVSTPACGHLYNIFHPTDPISYRIEPLVSRAMADLKPQPLPYTKRGIWAGTTQLAGGITGIGQTVSKSVSGFWSSLSSGIASSILNRSLGFNDIKAGEGGEREFERMKMQQQQMKAAEVVAKSKGGGGAIVTTTITGDENDTRTEFSQREQLPYQQPQSVPTLIDSEIETLYEGFQRSRQSAAQSRGPQTDSSSSNPSSLDEEAKMDEKARRLKLEEAKVRALNSTGRIDFAIQEGVFDVSLISSLASHLGYWNDEDVAHFMISQLLSRKARGDGGGRGGMASGQSSGSGSGGGGGAGNGAVGVAGSATQGRKKTGSGSGSGSTVGGGTAVDYLAGLAATPRRSASNSSMASTGRKGG